MRYTLPLLVLLISLTLPSAIQPAHGQWIEHTIDSDLDYAAGLAVTDMDGDGDLDVVASGYNDHTVLWYEAPTWTRHLIDVRLFDGYLRRPDDLDAGDISGDGLPDVVATSYSTGDIVWYEAPAWTRLVVDNNLNGAQHVKLGDLDGDGDLDIVATGRDRGDVRWYEAPSWTRHVVDRELAGGRGLYLADVNSDHVLDIIAAGMNANQVVWYEGPSWTKHLVDPDLGGAISVFAVDMDQDDQMDILAAGYSSNQVVMYKAPSWTKQVIVSGLGGARSVSAVDVDRDGDLDVVATGMRSNRIVWSEAPSWVEHEIDSGLLGAYFLQVADMDDDGDMDAVATGTESDEVVWCENALRAGVNQEEPFTSNGFNLHRSFPNPFRGSTTISYDLPFTADVHLAVFDALGRQVESLVTGHQSMGTHTVTWESKNAPSGIYFMRLEAGPFQGMRSVLLAR